LLSDQTLPFAPDLNVLVGDSDYSSVLFLGQLVEFKNLVSVTRSANNRVFYRQPAPLPLDHKPGKGHPTWYGDPFHLKDPTAWDAPDETIITDYTSRRGKRYTLHLEGWHDLLMRGKQGMPMHQHPFTLVRARLLNEEGKAVFKRPLWLIVLGEQRYELSLLETWISYEQRIDMEHFFRFGKQRLLLNDYQTPVDQHQENWVVYTY
jgi:hypothetical protein